MSLRPHKPAACPVHGRPTRRTACRQCNAAYMRSYMRRRRANDPRRTMCERARERARVQDVPFDLSPSAIVIPQRCPALDIPLRREAERSAHSPSLDRIRPGDGYVPGNVRVISDQANRLKQRFGLDDLRRLAEAGRPSLRHAYRQLATYVERELLLAKVRKKAKGDGPAAAEWAKVAAFLERRFAEGSGGVS